MSTITSTGVGSGLDVNSIVSSLMALERRPLSLLQERTSAIQTKLSAFGTLQGQVAALGDLATRLADPANWNPLRAESSRSDAATLSAGPTAAAGRYQLEVQQLAQAQRLASSAYASPTSEVGGGTLTLQLGKTAIDGSFTAGASLPVSLSIASPNATLAGVRNAINASASGVTASIVTSGGQSRLVLRTPEGQENSVRITVADDDGNNLDAAGLSALAWDPAAAPGSGRNLSQTQSAQDAKFTIDGVALTNGSNQVAGVVEGLTLTLRQVTTGTPVDLSVSTETMAVRKNVNDFVNAYNSLTKLLTKQTQADPSGKSRGPLQADSSAMAVLNSMREMLRGDVIGASGPSSLSSAGIELQRDGALAVKDAKLTPLLNSPAQLAKLFTQTAESGDAKQAGFGHRFKAWAKTLSDDTGTLSSRMEGLKGTVTARMREQESLQNKLTQTEARLRAQYQRLDTEMSKMNGQLNQMRSALGLNNS